LGTCQSIIKRINGVRTMIYVILEWIDYNTMQIITDHGFTKIFDTKKSAESFAKKNMAFNYKIVEVE